MSKGSALLLVFAIVSSSLITAEPVSASIAKPSVPEFTLKYIVTSYNVPEVFRINPYTGENEAISPSYNGERRHIEITVKNQQFTPYTDANGNLVNVYYNVSLKGHYRDVWGHYPDSAYEDLFNASTSDHTVILLPLGSGISVGGELDFRLEALIGHYDYARTSSGTEYVTGFSIYEASGWSDTQTLTIDESKATVTPDTSSPSPSVPPSGNQSPTASPNQSGPQTIIELGLDWTQIAMFALLGVIAVLLMFVVVFLRKRSTK